MWKQLSSDVNSYDTNDNSSRTRYDFGIPTDGPASTCWLYPHPRGTYHSVGGLLFTYDCLTNYEITHKFNALVRRGRSAPVLFGDANRTQYASASPANVKNPWGEEYQSSDVQAWDCSQPQPVQQTVPQQQAGGLNLTTGPTYVNVSQPRVPPSVAVGGSPAGTTNATMSGFDRCTRRTDTVGGGTGGAYANLPYSQEIAAQTTASRQLSDDVLAPVRTTRPYSCGAAANNQCVVEATTVTTLLGQGTPSADVGARIHRTEGFWTSRYSHIVEGPGWDSNHGQLQGIVITTFYAYVSPGAVASYGLSLPSKLTGSYGSEACGTATTGTKNGWDCDASHWWRDALGRDDSFRSPFLGRDPTALAGAPCNSANGWNATLTSADQNARGCVQISPYPGSPYNLRDIDCYDMGTKPTRDASTTALGTGAYGGTGFITSQACDEAT